MISPLEYDYITNLVSGKRIAIVLNDDIKSDVIKPIELLCSLPFEISTKPSDNRKNLIQHLGVGHKQFIAVKNGNTGETAVIDKKTIEKSHSNISVKESTYRDFCLIIYSCEYLFKTSQKILSYEDAKNDSSQIIKRYANIAKITGGEYLLEFIVKDNNKVHLYAINCINNAVSTKRLHKNNSSALDTATYSIAKITAIFKSKLVEKYNLDYRKALKKKNKHLNNIKDF